MSLNKTKIEWVVNRDGSKGYTWNSYTGCLHNFCDYCYAKAITERFTQMYPQGFLPTLHLSRMKDLEKMTNKQSRTIFVSSMGDLFGAWQERYQYDEYVIEAIKKDNLHRKRNGLTPNIYIFLTKNPKGYIRALNLDFKSAVLPRNFWFGVTLENMGSDKKNRLVAEDFYNTGLVGKANTFVSMEPLLDFNTRASLVEDLIREVDWLIVGALNSKGKPQPPKDEQNVGAIIDELKNDYNANLFVKDSIRKMEGTYYEKKDHDFIQEQRYIPWENVTQGDY